MDGWIAADLEAKRPPEKRCDCTECLLGAVTALFRGPFCLEAVVTGNRGGWTSQGLAQSDMRQHQCFRQPSKPGHSCAIGRDPSIHPIFIYFA